jgi:hypothetical protein
MLRPASLARHVNQAETLGLFRVVTLNPYVGGTLLLREKIGARFG